MRTSRLVYWSTLAAAAVWLAGIFLAPHLLHSGKTGPAAFIYALFSNVCHQIGSRCFHLSGLPLAVCGRCLGIYVGFFLALLILPATSFFPRPPLLKPRLFILLSLPMAADFTAGLLGLYASSNALRFATGLVWGGAVMPYFIAAMNGLAGLFPRPSRGRVDRGRDIPGQA